MTDVLQNPEVVVAAIGLAGVVASSIGTLVVKDWLSRVRRPAKEQRQVMQGLQQMHRIYSLMGEMIDECDADRVILFAGHNSGGLPRAHSPYWTTALHWATRDKDRASMLKDYQNITVDAEYIRMLLLAESQGFVELVPEDMPRCQLRDYLLAEGVRFAVTYHLGIREHKLLYLSAVSYEGPFQAAKRALLDLKAARIRHEVMNVL